MRVAEAGVDAQRRPAGHRPRGTVPLQLRHRVEDHLVGDLGDGDDLIGIPGDAVRVHLLAELLAAEARLVQRAARRAVQVPAHQPEHAPGGEALQREHGLGAGLVTYAADDLQVLLEAALVDQVVGGAKGHAQVLDGTGDKAYAVATANEAGEDATRRPESPSPSASPVTVPRSRRSRRSQAALAVVAGDPRSRARTRSRTGRHFCALNSRAQAVEKCDHEIGPSEHGRVTGVPCEGVRRASEHRGREMTKDRIVASSDVRRRRLAPCDSGRHRFTLLVSKQRAPVSA